MRLVTIFCCLCISMNSVAQRLTLTIEQLKDKKCQIVENYYEYVKHVQVVADDSYEPSVRNANEIALDRLLHREFVTSDFSGGNRTMFIEYLKSKTDKKELLKKSYTVFDCPSFDFISRITDDSDISEEIEAMDIIDQNIKTTKYKGWMLFAEEEYESYRINKSWLNAAETGISKNALVKKLHYEIYPLDSIISVLKIYRIEKVDKVETNIQEDTLGKPIVVWRKAKPKEFVPCCVHHNPADSDDDSYNDLVDCAPNNNLIYPGAPEIIADGIDQDCSGADQLGEDKDGDGYYYSACESKDPKIRAKCDCNEEDEDVFFRDSLIAESEWFQPDNGWNDDNCDCIKDRTIEIPLNDLNTFDYVVPGLGHFKRGPESTFWRKTVGYTLGLSAIGTTAYSIVLWNKSGDDYQKHLDSERFRNSIIYLEEANSHRKNARIYGGISALLYAVHLSWLGIKDAKQKTLRKQTIEKDRARPIDSKICYVPKLELDYSENNIGISLIFNLN